MTREERKELNKKRNNEINNAKIARMDVSQEAYAALRHAQVELGGKQKGIYSLADVLRLFFFIYSNGEKTPIHALLSVLDNMTPPAKTYNKEDLPNRTSFSVRKEEWYILNMIKAKFKYDTNEMILKVVESVLTYPNSKDLDRFAFTNTLRDRHYMHLFISA